MPNKELDKEITCCSRDFQPYDSYYFLLILMNSQKKHKILFTLQYKFRVALFHQKSYQNFKNVENTAQLIEYKNNF